MAGRRLNVFTIPPGAHFAETLARGVIERAGSGPFAIADTTIYLPTRRAARGFGDVFTNLLGGAALLPDFRPLGDVDEDELVFRLPLDEPVLLPAIAPIRRRLLLATLVRRWSRVERKQDIGFARAASLADSLSALFDEAATQQADLDRLDGLIDGALAKHWSEVRDF